MGNEIMASFAWDMEDTDGHCTFQWENAEMVVVVQVFGIRWHRHYGSGATSTLGATSTAYGSGVTSTAYGSHDGSGATSTAYPVL